jgi:hypothetical protein
VIFVKLRMQGNNDVNMKLNTSVKDAIIKRVMLTCALKAQVKELKIELSNKFYVEKITFETFKTLNAQFPRKNFYFRFLNLCLKGTS